MFGICVVCLQQGELSWIMTIFTIQWSVFSLSENRVRTPTSQGYYIIIIFPHSMAVSHRSSWSFQVTWKKLGCAARWALLLTFILSSGSSMKWVNFEWVNHHKTHIYIYIINNKYICQTIYIYIVVYIYNCMYIYIYT